MPRLSWHRCGAVDKHVQIFSSVVQYCTRGVLKGARDVLFVQ